MYNNTSLAVVPLRVKGVSGQTLSVATGFWYRRSQTEQPYLITNWHVVTGREPASPSRSRNGAVPVSISTSVHAEMGESADGPLIHPAVTVNVTLAINEPDGEEPAWLEHPTLKFRADVVAIPVPDLERAKPKLSFSAFGDAGMLNPHPLFEPNVTDDVFVIGYPWGLTGGGAAMPIYKRGSVASEPALPQAGLPRFLIDCRTASGLSGSPVMAVRSVFGDKIGPGGEARFGRGGGFVGIYSGRLLSREAGSIADAAGAERDRAEQEISEIGIVWQRRVLEEILNAGARGSKLSDLAAEP
jgi:hypothetical protein